jgi:2-(1,2-epoxy-1,2-dihydrophenyl)acetyl-CoA isomerase
MSEQVIVEHKNGLATVTLNRPDQMNALTVDMLLELPVVLRELSNDSSVRCVLLTGAGDRAFSAGADMNPAADATQDKRFSPELEPSIDLLNGFQEAPWLLHRMTKPTIAAVNGAAAGASLSLALACDFRVASDTAIFNTAFVRIGFSGDFGGSFFMTHLIGAAKTRELYMLGERIDAAEALSLGMVNRVFPAAKFRTETAAFVQRLVDGPPIALRYMKRNLNLALNGDLRTVLDLEAEAMMRTARSDDFRNAVRAFLNKEKPHFEGR